MVTNMNINMNKAHTEKWGDIIVVKVGSALLINEKGKAREQWMHSLCDEIASLHASGSNIILVTSGAIAMGRERLGWSHDMRPTLSQTQAAAAVGQITLSQLWSTILGKVGLISAQILLTAHDLEDRRRYLNIVATFETLLAARAIAVVNENNSLATEEIRFGDNDRLAARVASALRAERLILLSDVDGLYSADPQSNHNAQFIDNVTNIDASILEMADNKNKSADHTNKQKIGTGGMLSKLQAAQIAQIGGVEMLLISGIAPYPLSQYIHSRRGTIFRAKRTQTGLKSWLNGKLAVAGKIIVDEGAVHALQNGASLLSVGICSVHGHFMRGDVVDIVDQEARVIARGLSEYESSNISQIMGQKSSEQEAILGYYPRSAIVHRNQMLLF